MKEIATHSSSYAWEIPQTEEPHWLPSTGSERVGHDLTTQQLLLLALVWDICYTLVNQCVCVLSSAIVSKSLQPYGLQSTRLLCPWDFSSKNTRVGFHFLLQGIFPTQGLNLVSCVFCIGRQVLYHCASWKVSKDLFHSLILTQRIDTVKLWCWGRLLRVPWTARRLNESILKEINTEYLLEGLMLKLQFFGHLMRRANSLEKTLILGKIKGKRSRGWQRMRWLNTPPTQRT